MGPRARPLLPDVYKMTYRVAVEFGMTMSKYTCHLCVLYAGSVQVNLDTLGQGDCKESCHCHTSLATFLVSSSLSSAHRYLEDGLGARHLPRHWGSELSPWEGLGGPRTWRVTSRDHTQNQWDRRTRQGACVDGGCLRFRVCC
jgi:hypothetical protein